MNQHNGQDDCEACQEVTASLENLEQAIQRYANAINDGEVATIVAESVVVFETMRMNPDGSDGRMISWTIPSKHWSLATAVGLLEMGEAYIKRDLVPVNVQEHDHG